jgi:hypothetical protein
MATELEYGPDDGLDEKTVDAGRPASRSARPDDFAGDELEVGDQTVLGLPRRRDEWADIEINTGAETVLVGEDGGDDDSEFDAAATTLGGYSSPPPAAPRTPAPLPVRPDPRFAASLAPAPGPVRAPARAPAPAPAPMPAPVPAPPVAADPRFPAAPPPDFAEQTYGPYSGEPELATIDTAWSGSSASLSSEPIQPAGYSQPVYPMMPHPMAGAPRQRRSLASILLAPFRWLFSRRRRAEDEDLDDGHGSQTYTVVERMVQQRRRDR